MMMEDLAHMGPMLVLAGLLIGLTAETVSRARGYGLMTDMVVGLVGSVIVGGIVLIGVSHPGMLWMFLIGAAGGAIAIVAQRALWRSTRLGT